MTPCLMRMGVKIVPLLDESRAKLLAGHHENQRIVKWHVFRDFNCFFSTMTWNNSTPALLIRATSLVWIQINPKIMFLLLCKIISARCGSPFTKLMSSTVFSVRWTAISLCSGSGDIFILRIGPRSEASMMKLMVCSGFEGDFTVIPVAPPLLTEKTYGRDVLD